MLLLVIPSYHFPRSAKSSQNIRVQMEYVTWKRGMARIDKNWMGCASLSFLVPYHKQNHVYINDGNVTRGLNGRAKRLSLYGKRPRFQPMKFPTSILFYPRRTLVVHSHSTAALPYNRRRKPPKKGEGRNWLSASLSQHSRVPMLSHLPYSFHTHP